MNSLPFSINVDISSFQVLLSGSQDLYPHPDWSKFIWLDYPNHDSWHKHLQTKKSGKIGRFDAIGSEIGIHGVPNNGDYMIDEGLNWT